MIFVMPGGSKRKRDSVGEHLRCAVNRVKKSLALTILRNVCGQLSNPGRGFSSPPVENIKEKSQYFRTGSHLEYGGEGGIRTPDTLPYTHFPGVLLQPLGHLTILSFPLLSGTGANVGKYVSPVNQLFAKKARLDKLRATCSLNVRNPFFLSPVAFPFSLGGNLLCWQTNRKQ